MPENKNKITFEKIKGGNNLEVALSLRADGSDAKAEISFSSRGTIYPERQPPYETCGGRILSLEEAKILAEKLNEFIERGEEFEANN